MICKWAVTASFSEKQVRSFLKFADFRYLLGIFAQSVGLHCYDVLSKFEEIGTSVHAR